MFNETLTSPATIILLVTVILSGGVIFLVGWRQNATYPHKTRIALWTAYAVCLLATIVLMTIYAFANRGNINQPDPTNQEFVLDSLQNL